MINFLDHQHIILAALLFMSATFTAIPYCRSVYALYMTSFGNGLSTGFLIDIGNVWIIHMFGRENAFFMQITHFAFGLGCFAGPFIAEPFLLPDDKQAHQSTAHQRQLQDVELKHYTADDVRIQYGYAIGGAVNVAFFVLFLITFLFQTSNIPHHTRIQPKRPTAIVPSTRPTPVQPLSSKPNLYRQPACSTESCKTSTSTLVDNGTV